MFSYNDHLCSLADVPSFEKTVLQAKIYSRNFLLNRIMRKLQLLITISPRLKYSTLFRSRKKITKAAQDHIMSRYWYIIHPHSLLEYYYSFYITLVYILAMITVPVLVVTPSTVNFFHYLQVLLDFLLLLNVVKNFFTGYVDDAEEVVVLETKRIAKKYVMFYFWMDLVSAVPGLTFFAGNTKTGKLELSVNRY